MSKSSDTASGCGCFLIMVGAAVAFAIVHWTLKDFPPFWRA